MRRDLRGGWEKAIIRAAQAVRLASKRKREAARTHGKGAAAKQPCQTGIYKNRPQTERFPLLFEAGFLMGVFSFGQIAVRLFFRGGPCFLRGERQATACANGWPQVRTERFPFADSGLRRIVNGGALPNGHPGIRIRFRGGAKRRQACGRGRGRWRHGGSS